MIVLLQSRIDEHCPAVRRQRQSIGLDQHANVVARRGGIDQMRRQRSDATADGVLAITLETARAGQRAHHMNAEAIVDRPTKNKAGAARGAEARH